MSQHAEYEAYESLLLERDQRSKEAEQIWTAYLRQFGQLLTDNYAEKLACIECKKTIAYYQRAINQGGTIQTGEMETYLDQEMAAYYAQLRHMLREQKSARAAHEASAYEVARSKTLYRRLAKLIHPDIHPETDYTEELQVLWNRILGAYHQNDVKTLAELEVLVRKVLSEQGMEMASLDIPDLDVKLSGVQAEIDEITHSEPYTLRYLLEDETAAEKKRAALQGELESYQKYHKELQCVIEQMLHSGGLQIYVS